MRPSIGLCLALAGCAQSPLQAIKTEVDGRLVYQHYAARDFRAATSGGGNCAVFAATYKAEASRLGIKGEVRTCLLRDGQGHAYFRAADGTVLDVRYPEVERETAVDCLPGSVRVVGGGVALR